MELGAFIVCIVGALLAGAIIGEHIGWFRGKRYGEIIGRLEGYHTCKEDYKKAMDDVVYEQMCEIAANKGRERAEDGEDWKE